jgi:hypothetical protein
MFALGGLELLFIVIFPFSGLLAALYLGLALRNKSHRDQPQPGPASRS